MSVVNESQDVSIPLGGVGAVLYFILLVLLVLLTALVTCSRYFEIPYELKLLTVEFFVIIISIGWFSFTVSKDLGDFQLHMLGLSILVGPIIGMHLLNSAGLFWISLLITTLCAILLVLKSDSVKNHGFWIKLLTTVYVAWVVVGIIVTLGGKHFFQYASKITILTDIHPYLDLRYLLTGILLTAAVGDAWVNAYRAGLPHIRSLPDLRFKDPRNTPTSFTQAILRPFIIVINVGLLIFQVITNIFWKLIVIVLTYFYRIAVNLANRLFELLSDKNIIIWVARVLVTFILVSLFTRGVIYVSPIALTYLLSTIPFLTLPPDKSALIILTGFFLMTFLLILCLCTLWDDFDDVYLIPAASYATVILIAFFLTGLFMYGLAEVSQLDIVGFNAKSPGPFSILILGILGSLFTFQILKRVASR